jgi:hypothetical protein
MGEGTKHDAGKPRIELVPTEGILGVAEVLTFGAKKYGDRNWEQGISLGRVYGAVQRHLLAWWAGEDTDPESGLSHLAHAACGVFFLMFFTRRGMKILDDRPSKANL